MLSKKIVECWASTRVFRVNKEILEIYRNEFAWIFQFKWVGTAKILLVTVRYLATAARPHRPTSQLEQPGVITERKSPLRLAAALNR
ncbi:MAG: hypothetical protein JKY26_15880 [Pseudomonas sp.]|nr:hypothetical protein [Pseudomonas sp.]